MAPTNEGLVRPVTAKASLDRLVELGIRPHLHYTATEHALEEDAKWCCHDEDDEIMHAHGRTAFIAIRDLLAMAQAEKERGEEGKLGGEVK